MNTYLKLMAIGACLALTVPTVFADLESGLEAWWDMDEIVTEDGVRKVKDRSGNGRDLTCGDDLVVVSDAERGKCLNFPGGDKTWSTFVTPGGMSNRTLSFWMYHDPATGSHYYNSKGGCMPCLLENLNGWKTLLSCSLATGKNDPGNGSVYAPNTVVAEAAQLSCPGDLFKTGVWRHHSLMLELKDMGSGNWKVRSINYVNGRFVHASDWYDRTNFQNYFSSRIAWFGNQSHTLGDAAATGNRPMHALFDEVRLFSRLLTAEEAFAEYERSRNANRTELVRWSMSNGSASSVTDDSGRGHSLVLGSDTELVSAATSGTPGGTGALLLKPRDGDDVSGAALAHTDNFKIPREHTVSFWLKQLPGGNRNPNLFRPNTPGGFYLMGTKDGGSVQLHDTWSTAPRILDGGVPISLPNEWVHVIVSTHYVFDPSTSNLVLRCAMYSNGTRTMIGAPDCYQVTEDMNLSDMGLYLSENSTPNLYVGSSGDGNRSFNGYLADYRIFGYAVSDQEAADLYRSSCADNDEIVTSRETVGLRIAGDAAERGSWRVVSAPAGGEESKAMGSAEGETIVDLPVCGEYVFASVEYPWCVCKVRRIASDPSNLPPEVAVSAVAASVQGADGLASVQVAATVTDDGKLGSCRGRWSKVSGPGGVWFVDVANPVTTARFGSAGDYVIRFTTDDGQATASADLSITVSGVESSSADLANGLVAYWGMNDPSVTVETVGKGVLSPNSRARFASAGRIGHALANASVELTLKTDRTGVDVVPGYATTGYNNCLLEETIQIGGVNYIKDTYRTVSLWMYHDPTVPGASDVKYAILVGQQYSFQLVYNPLDGADTFRIYTQGNGGATCSLDFAKPSFSTRGKWVHVCFVLNRRDGSADDNAVWVNGVKLERTAQSGLANIPRIGSGTLSLGGMSASLDWSNRNHMNNYLLKSGTSMADAEWYSRSFPGKVDEVRVWNRCLTEGEIRRLAVGYDLDPVAPVAISISAPTEFAARSACTIAASACRDPRSSSVTSVYSWKVVSGDASKVAFDDPSALEPTVVVKKAGTYVIQLTVTTSEGVVKAYPVTLTVYPTGLSIILR